MSATARSQWYWSDWLGDQAVRRLTPAERGVWIDLLAFAAAGVPTGYVTDAKGRQLTHDEIARVTNAGSPVEVAKLIDSIVEKGAASRDRTGRLFNRRMVRDTELAAKRKFAGKLGGDHTSLINKSNRVLVQQMAQQVLQQTEAPKNGLTNKKLNLSSETTAAREALEPQQVGEKKAVATPYLAEIIHKKSYG